MKVIKQTSPVDDKTLQWLLNGMESLDQGFSLFDERLHLVYCNGRYLELLGLPQCHGESGCPLESTLQFNAERGEYGTGDKQQQVETRLQRARRLEKYCFIHRRPTGQLLEIRGMPLSGGGFLTTYTDITERLQAQQSAALYEQQLTNIVQACAIPMFVLDKGRRVTHWNRACELATGILAQEMIGSQDAWRAFYPQPRPVLAELILSQLSEREILRYYGEKKCRQSRIFADGYEAEDFFPDIGDSGVWLYFTAAPVRGPDGSMVGVVETLQDVTERNQAQAELEHHQQQLEVLIRHRTQALSLANEELSQYAYVVSHDLKAPLRAIRNYADFLTEDLKGTLEAEQEAYLLGMRKALGQGEQMVEDLLEYSGIAKADARHLWFDPVPLITDLLVMMQLDEDIQVAWQPSWPTLYGDPLLVTQIFQNLISNGSKFNRSQQKRVELGWYPLDDEGIEIWVGDNGIGIEKNYHEQIFRVFRRLHLNSEYAGTGIGLAIVKKAALHLGWSTRLESEPDRGTVFYFKVPTNCYKDALQT